MSIATPDPALARRRRHGAIRSARWRERRRNGVLRIVPLELLKRDLDVLVEHGLLPGDRLDDAEAISDAVGKVLDRMAR